MITYELAKQLKNAGFPQHIERVVSTEEVTCHNIPVYDHRIFDLSLMGYPKEEPDYYTQGKWRSAHYFSRQYIDSDECDILYYPTLSELIEACGEKFHDLTRCGLQYKSAKAIREIETNLRIPGGWEASSEEKEDEYTWEWGSTPEEAVAKLYIELHHD